MIAAKVAGFAAMLAIIGAAAGDGTPSYVTGGGFVLIVGMIVTAYRARSQKHLDDTSAATNEAAREKIIEEMRTSVIAQVREDLKAGRERELHERERAAQAVAAQAVAQSQLAQTQVDLANTQAQLAGALTKASEERHSLQNQINERDAQIFMLSREVGLLREELAVQKAEVAQLRAQAGVRDRRR